jgi:hypothetical protein
MPPTTVVYAPARQVGHWTATNFLSVPTERYGRLLLAFQASGPARLACEEAGGEDMTPITFEMFRFVADRMRMPCMVYHVTDTDDTVACAIDNIRHRQPR